MHQNVRPGVRNAAAANPPTFRNRWGSGTAKTLKTGSSLGVSEPQIGKIGGGGSLGRWGPHAPPWAPSTTVEQEVPRGAPGGGPQGGHKLCHSRGTEKYHEKGVGMQL